MKIVVTFAIEEEVIDVPLKDAFIVPIVTGIGKANAAFSLTRAVLLEKPDMVLNIGTAGTQKHSVGDVFVCDHFITPIRFKKCSFMSFLNRTLIRSALI